MIGSMTIEYVDGGFISLYREENIPELHSAIVNGVSFQLGYKNDCFMLMTSGAVTVIDNPESVDTDFTDELIVSSSNETASYSKSVTAANRGRATSYQVSPTVQNVPNATHPDDSSHALCWAACVASVGMQYTNTTGDGALTVYNACKNSTSSNKPKGYDYPVGETAWYVFAFDEIYGMEAISNSALSSNQVMNLLLSNRPIIVRLRNSTNNTRKHAMVLFMYYNIDSSTGQYIFMDPGSSRNSGRLSVMIDSTVMNDGAGLTLTSRNGKYYDTWRYSIYRK